MIPHSPNVQEPRPGAGPGLLLFPLPEEPLQIDAADGGNSCIKTVVHFDLLSNLFDLSGGHIKRFGPAFNQDGNLILDMQVLAIGAMAVGEAADAFAFY